MRHGKIAVPDGDVLIHAGDFGLRGSLQEVRDFNRWLQKLPHTHKLVIAGNHDGALQTDAPLARLELDACTYLQDSAHSIDGVTFWGTPWTPTFYDWWFMGDEPFLARKFTGIAPDVDVLISHGPPHGILDVTDEQVHAGSVSLRDWLDGRPRPRVMIFGHIHEGYGILERDGRVYVNAAICNERYQPINKPVVLDL